MASHKKVALITHTGSDMPLDEAAGLGITIIPDKVLFGDEEYRNMTEISSQMFTKSWLQQKSCRPVRSLPRGIL